MTEIPRIALFQAATAEEEKISKLFQRHEYSIRSVETAEEVLDLVAEEDAPFDAFIVPLRLHDGSSGISACLQVKSHPSLASVPVLGLAYTGEKPVIQAFYEVGADVVLLSPSDSDLMRFQVVALMRQRKAYTEQIRKKQEDSGISRSVIRAFNIVREGLIIFNSNYEFSFGNASSRMMLGLARESQAEEILGVEKLFRQLLVQHQKTTKSMRSGPNQEAPVSRFETSLTRTDRRAFRATVRISSLYSTDGYLMGFALSITDLSELDQLSNSLLQSQRTRSLCLLSAASSVELLTGRVDSLLVSPMVKLEERNTQQPSKASVNTIMTTLMEYLDLVISPETRVKVKSTGEPDVALRPTDLFQLLGHILLHVVQFAGRAGEALVEIQDNVPGEGVVIMVTGQSRKVTPFIPNDYLASLIQGEIPVGDNEHANGKMSTGLRAAQELAQSYRSSVEYRMTEDGKLKVRIKLPPNYTGRE